MIAAQRDDVCIFSAGDQPVENCTGIGAAVDIVAERDELIVTLKGDEVGQRSECIHAAMNIADREVPHLLPFRCHSEFSQHSLLDCGRIFAVGSADVKCGRAG